MESIKVSFPLNASNVVESAASLPNALLRKVKTLTVMNNYTIKNKELSTTKKIVRRNFPSKRRVNIERIFKRGHLVIKRRGQP